MEAKTYANIVQNLLYFRLRDTSTYIGSTKFLTKVLWVYSHFKSDFFCEKKVTKIEIAYYTVIENRSKNDQRLSMMCLTISLITADNSYLPNLTTTPLIILVVDDDDDDEDGGKKLR